MRMIMIILCIIVYLFCLIYLESELVKIEIKKESLRNRITELKNEKNSLELKLARFTNLVFIETEARKRNFIFPKKDDILGVLK